MEMHHWIHFEAPLYWCNKVFLRSNIVAQSMRYLPTIEMFTPLALQQALLPYPVHELQLIETRSAEVGDYVSFTYITNVI